MRLQQKCLWKDCRHSSVLFFSFLSYLAARLCVFISYYLFTFLFIFIFLSFHPVIQRGKSYCWCRQILSEEWQTIQELRAWLLAPFYCFHVWIGSALRWLAKRLVFILTFSIGNPLSKDHFQLLWIIFAYLNCFVCIQCETQNSILHVPVILLKLTVTGK